jgi:hypothetical protein
VLAPAGWATSFGAATLPVNSGSSGSTTLTATAPMGTPVGPYSIVVSATNSLAPAYVGLSSVTENIISALGVTVSTQPTYLVGQTISIVATVALGAVPSANTRVTITVMKPDGITVLKKWTPTTNGAGTVKVSIRAPNVTGTYAVSAVATTSGTSASAATIFSVVR